ncbi:MAG: DEAD/DEAH box helicase family protein [Acidobacteriota bacterium]|nr:DEAD/DEAH box helicase family protein [Acidobacteriota bacterium]
MPPTPENNRIKELTAENTRLKALLDAHGINWRQEPIQYPSTPDNPQLAAHETTSPLDSGAKAALFRSLFRGRADVYALRWESAKGKSGYSPACDNEWKPGVCNKPRIKCGDCENRMLLPVTNQVIYDHLSGKQTIGVYPLLTDDTCWFLAVDFDEAEWREDAGAFMQSCRELGVPAALEISRSGQGAHVWIFFSGAVPARDARRLGAAIISHTCARTRQLSLTSYDRFFPNQDRLPKGGFGNLIALPLQKNIRGHGRSVFVDEQFMPWPDQWAFLASTGRMGLSDIHTSILKATDGGHPIDVAFVTEEDERKPWKRPTSEFKNIPGPLPSSLNIIFANQLFIEKSELPQPLANRLIRLAAFQNPEFYKAQAMRFPVWDKPRVIGCAENYPHHVSLPRGCLEAVLDLLKGHEIQPKIIDERVSGKPVSAVFIGNLREDQSDAVEATLNHETGILCAPTAFGKTVTAAALIARRRVSTLILVHRNELLKQWQERLTTFLEVPRGSIGVIGGGKKKPSGCIDIAVMQTLSRYENLGELLDQYGQIIVDECHHISAFSFESILKQARALFVVGLTATPVRRDGHQPIIFMQCGPIRHNAAKPDSAPAQLEVWPRMLKSPPLGENAAIQDVFRILTTDAQRNHHMAQDIIAAFREGRKIIALTERTEHLERLLELLKVEVRPCFVLHGRMSKKLRAEVMQELAELDDSIPRVILATGRLIGEGFDHPPLDTLVLCMPISWKGTLQQYAGRLHREHATKDDVRIYDYVEYDNPQLARMWDKRLRGYRNMGYVIHLG